MHLKMPIVFDNDCISSFSWINRLDIVNKLFPKQVIIPEIVYRELFKLKSTKYSFVFLNIEHEINATNFILKDIGVLDRYLSEYLQLISMNNPKRIGKGEAAALVIAKSLNGTLASNNLSDVIPRIKDNVPPLIYTEHILYYSWEEKIITAEEGELIWQSMKAKKRKLPNCSFAEIIAKFNNMSE